VVGVLIVLAMAVTSGPRNVGPTGVPSRSVPAADTVVSAASASAPGLCFGMVASAIGDAGWQAVSDALVASARSAVHLFPQPEAAEGPTSLGIWEEPESGLSRPAPLCAVSDAGWQATVGRGMLERGALRRAASVELSAGTTAAVSVRFDPKATLVRTQLDFSMPLGVGGKCWVDDRLGVEAGTGRAVSARQVGQYVTLFGDYGCRRFLELMPEGGAGEQAVELLPWEVPVGGGSVVRLVATSVTLDEDAITVAGRFEQ
jgi:hypothetical protein